MDTLIILNSFVADEQLGALLKIALLVALALLCGRWGWRTATDEQSSDREEK